MPTFQQESGTSQASYLAAACLLRPPNRPQSLRARPYERETTTYLEVIPPEKSQINQKAARGPAHLEIMRNYAKKHNFRLRTQP